MSNDETPSLFDAINAFVEQDELVLLVARGRGLQVIFRKDFDNEGTIIGQYYGGELVAV